MQKEQRTKGAVVWLTGLSGAGKTTIANAVYGRLLKRGIRAEILDGDQVRDKLSRGLGFTKADRDENVRRLGYVANLLAGHEVVVLVAAIAPYRDARAEVRQMCRNYVEVFVNAPFSVCEARDPKGLYRRARNGEIKQFTGIDDPYEPPLAAEVMCKTGEETIEESADRVMAFLSRFLSQ